MTEAAESAPRVLVVGAGPVGLAMGSELFRYGVPARIIDRSRGPSRESRAIVVQARTLEIFEGMGILAPVLAAGRKIHQLNIYTRGDPIAQIAFDELDSPYPFILILPQSELEAILADRLTRLGGRIEWGVSLEGVVQDDRGVASTLRSRGRKEELRTPWLIGCDGMESTVRDILLPSGTKGKPEEGYLLMDAPVQWDLTEDGIHQFLTDDGVLAAFPLPRKGWWRLILEGVDAEPTVDAFLEFMHRAAFAGSFPETPEWTSSYRVRRHLASRFRIGRCFLAGDAAHTFSPVGGQGMNLGLQDAHNLAWKIGLVEHHRAWEWLLNSYHNERHHIAAAIQRETDRAARVVTLRHPVARQIRRQAASLLGQFEVVQQRVARRLLDLDLTYRQSSIVEEYHVPLLGSCLHVVDKATPSAAECLEFGAAPRAGERVPDLEIAGTAQSPRRRLYDLLQGTVHTLLLFTGSRPTPESCAVIEQGARQIGAKYGQIIRTFVVFPFSDSPGGATWPSPTLPDPGGLLHRRLGICSGGMYLIRPDGYIGYRSQPVLLDNFTAYLKRTFTAPRPS